MGFTNAGLTNGGVTAHFSVQYDDTLSVADGKTRTNAFLAAVEGDFALMKGWFGGIDLVFTYPVAVQIVNASGGASWTTPPNIDIDLHLFEPTIVIKPGSSTSANIVRYLLVSEVVEMFMLSQGKGWGFDNQGFFQGADEGSKGEGLSRFLGVQFQIAKGMGSIPPAGFGVARNWLNGPRIDVIDINPDDNQPDIITGCTTLFIYFLHSQLGFSINSIVSAAAATLAGVFKNLTGKTDAFPSFIDLVNAHYPPGITYHPAGDNIFPVSDLASFKAPTQIVCGYNGLGTITLNKPAMAEVTVKLASSDTTELQVPPSVTIGVGAISANFTINTKAIPSPFATKVIKISATYAGKTLTDTVDVVPPVLTSLTLSPSTVVCGNSSIATVTLDAPSLSGPVVVDVFSSDSYATVSSPVTIPQNFISKSFVVNTPNIIEPFIPVKVDIFATFGNSFADAFLTVEPKVIEGIVNSVTVSPATIIGGGISHGTVTLYQPVPTDTLVGLAAVVTGAHFPLSGNASDEVTVPASVTVPANHISATFNVTTKKLTPPQTKNQATIIAGAVVTKYALLTVIS